MAAELTKELYADDGLASPIPTTPTVSNLAKGRDRTLALGAGGEYYIAWYCGFFHGLGESAKEHGGEPVESLTLDSRFSRDFPRRST